MSEELKRSAFLLLLLIVISVALFSLWNLLNMLILALILAYLVEVLSEPVERFLERKGVKIAQEHRVLFSYAFVLTSLLILLLLIIPPVVFEVGRLISEFPGHLQSLKESLSSLVSSPIVTKLPIKFDEERLLQLGGQALSNLGSFLSNTYSVFTSTLSSLLSAVLLLLIIPIFSLYISYTKDSIYRGAVEIFPRSLKGEVSFVLITFDKAMREYMKGISLNVLLIWFGTSLALLPLFKGSSLGLGFIYGVSSIVPIVGPIVGAALGVIIAFSKSVWLGMWVLVIYVLIQLLCDNFVTPRVIGGSLKMSPLAVILSMAAFFKLIGISGPLIAVPVSYTLWRSLSRWASRL